MFSNQTTLQIYIRNEITLSTFGTNNLLALKRLSNSVIIIIIIKTLFIEAAHLGLPSLPCGPLENYNLTKVHDLTKCNYA